MPDTKAIASARRLLKTVEREITADWTYHDWNEDAVDVIKALAKHLRAIVGPEPVTTTRARPRST